MGWFKRIQGGITTSTNDKRKFLKDYGINVLNVNILYQLKNMNLGLSVCQKCGFHERIMPTAIFHFFLMMVNSRVRSKNESKDP